MRMLTKRARFSLRSLAGLLVLLGLMLTNPPAAQAQEIACDGASELPCGLAVEALDLQRAPAVFHFQSRIAQSKLPVDDVTFPTVIVKLLEDANVLCTEEMTNVIVRGSVLNLTIGRHMSCPMDEVIAEHSDLSFQICLGGGGNCLKPIPLATTAFAVKATYAQKAQQATEANISAQAHYAHRATADREMYLRDELGAGYFDFHTPAGGDAPGAGFLQWRQVRAPSPTRLHIAGAQAEGSLLATLEHLLLSALRVLVRGDLIVDPPVGGAGLVVASAGAHVQGDSNFFGSLAVHSSLTGEAGFTVSGDASVTESATVAEGLTVLAGGAHVTGDAHLTGALNVSGDLVVPGALSGGDTLTVTNLLGGTTANIDGDLTVGGTAALAELTTDDLTSNGALSALAATVAGDLFVGGNLDLDAGLVVHGPVEFRAPVRFEGGTSDPNGGDDMRYVRFEDEARAVAFGGAVALASGLTMGDDLNLQYNAPVNFAFEQAAAAPAACDASNEGRFYYDESEAAVLICNAGSYRKMGGDECGNGNVEPTEACDDGNVEDGDGCDATCRVEDHWVCDPNSQPSACDGFCGDGLLYGDEECDTGYESQWGMEPGCVDCRITPGYYCSPSDCTAYCGNLQFDPGEEDCDYNPNFAGQGCEPDCTASPGWTCTDGVCVHTCGNGQIDPGEECDDGNYWRVDGCDHECRVEEGWTCDGSLPSQCSPICGNGVWQYQGGEGCDDGNDTSGDGCTDCTVDPQFSCVGSPSVCTTKCGDGNVDTSLGEECDDGNRTNNDGCSSSCQLECGDGIVTGDEDCDDQNDDNWDGCTNWCKESLIVGQEGASVTRYGFRATCWQWGTDRNGDTNCTVATVAPTDGRYCSQIGSGEWRIEGAIAPWPEDNIVPGRFWCNIVHGHEDYGNPPQGSRAVQYIDFDWDAIGVTGNVFAGVASSEYHSGGICDHDEWNACEFQQDFMDYDPYAPRWGDCTLVYPTSGGGNSYVVTPNCGFEN